MAKPHSTSYGVPWKQEGESAPTPAAEDQAPPAPDGQDQGQQEKGEG